MTDSPVFLFHLLIEFHLLKTPPRGHLANCLDFMFSNQIQYWDIFFFFLGCMFWGYIHLTGYNLVIRRSMIDNVYEKKNFLAGIFFFQFGLITLRLNWWILLKKIFSLSFFFFWEIEWVSYETDLCVSSCFSIVPRWLLTQTAQWFVGYRESIGTSFAHDRLSLW